MRHNRRQFLTTTVLGTAAATILRIPRAAAQSSNANDFEFHEATIASLSDAIRSGKLTARRLAEAYLQRIEAIDKRGPAVNSIIELNPDALQIADELDRERQARGPRGPLHGIPVLIKDNIATHDRMMTTAGSLALKGSIPARDAFIARKLREAGAVILGKTNLSEWANFRSKNSTSGWSARGGLTRNPYVLDRNPCGSSSGSGVAVSANLCAVAIGTETDGSIVCPSSANGIVGIKPTLGLVSRSGIIPIAHSQDTAGPMTRTVADAAVLLTALQGFDPDDKATDATRGKAAVDYTKYLDPNSLRGARLGVVRKYAGFSSQVDHLLEEAIAAMKSAGAEIIDPVEIAGIGKFDATEMQVLLYEFKTDLNKYLSSLAPSAPVHSLQEIIEFNDKHAREELPFFGQDIMIDANKKGPLSTSEYRKALDHNHRLTRKDGIDAAIEKHKLDALIAPTGGPAWTTDLINGDHFVGGSSSSLPAVAGYPNINVPMGFTFGLPIGLSFFGRAGSEPMLIKLAYAYEQTTRQRKPPQFLPTAELSSS